MNSPFKIKCNSCNIEYEIKYDHPENVATTYVICPNCKKKVYAASDFGFGPVWPAYMYYGNHLFLMITFSPDHQYEIKDKFNLRKEIILPKKYVSDNYNYHFDILEYIHENMKEFMDTKDAKID